MKFIKASLISTLLLLSLNLLAKKYHVAKTGNDNNPGTLDAPFLTIQAAADVAYPGDVITVHEGIYREGVNPKQGGTCELQRIVYQAAEGEKVVIKGSEAIRDWKRENKNVWKVTIPNTFFKGFNPYSDLIRGDWFNDKGRSHHTGAVYLNEHWLVESATKDDLAEGKWFAEVDDSNTTIWAQFGDVNPNYENVEINVRQTVFYPKNPGINYITVSGFKMMHAATPWAPPTAEQIGLIGTHWSKGWIIEDNDISYSVCAGITLGKYGDEFDNTSADSAEGYVKTVERAAEKGWTKAHVGSHVIRNNHVSHCEQAGIVGSLGAIYSTITGNTVHEIHQRKLFGGFEQAALKIHGAVECLISENHFYDSSIGIWLDWLTHGTRVTRNLLHDNQSDFSMEANHGPYILDNNIMLSPGGHIQTRGSAFAHNLMAMKLNVVIKDGRLTPLLKEHSTQEKGIARFDSGDERYFNNIIVNGGLAPYDDAVHPVFMNGNVSLKGAKASKHETGSVVLPNFDPDLRLEHKADGIYLHIKLNKAWAEKQNRQLVTTELLGKTLAHNLSYLAPNGSPLVINTDYFGNKRNVDNPFPGPFEIPEGGELMLKVWPME